MGRPPGVVGRTQLKPEDLVRIQTLSRDARMGPTEIRRVTGYSIHQIKYALKKKTPTVGKRTGRPRKGEADSGSGEGGGAGSAKEKRRREKAGMGGECAGQRQVDGLEQRQSGGLEGSGKGNEVGEGAVQGGEESEEEGKDVEEYVRSKYSSASLAEQDLEVANSGTESHLSHN